MENSLENFDVDIVFRPIAYVSLASTLQLGKPIANALSVMF